MERCEHGVMKVAGDNAARYCTVCTAMNTEGWDGPQVRVQDHGLTDSDYAFADDSEDVNESFTGDDDDDEY